MKMAAEEIVERYNQDRSRANMQQIADENGCTLKEIGEFLKRASENQPKKKPGRPKKQEADTILKDKKEKKSIKSNSVLDEMRPQRYLIPPLVSNLTTEKIAELKRKKEFFEQKAYEMTLEIDELQDFLNGGFSENGEKS